MKYFTKNVFAFLFAMVCVGMTSNLTAQIFTDDFSSEPDFQAEWVTGGMNTGSEDWVWTLDAGNPTFGSQPDFVSTTVANGFIQFNSDANGDVSHDVTVTTVNPFDATSADQVFMEFQNQYAFFSGSSTAQVGVSTDGTVFTYYPVLENVAQNTLTSANQTVIVELPEAANQPEVWIQFRWQGAYEYAWKIDDISISDFNPTPAVQYNIGAYTFYPPSSYSQPIEQIEVDSFGFFAEVMNTGSGDLTNVEVKATVLTEGGAELYSASAVVDVIEAGTTDTVDIDGLFGPNNLDLGLYNIVYEITPAEGDDANPTDNSLSESFVVSSNRFSKVESTPLANRPGGGTDYLIANVYQTSPNIMPDAFAFGEVTFSAAVNPAEGDPLDGREANLILAKIKNDVVDANYNGFDEMTEILTNESMEVLAFVPHTFVGANFDEQTTTLTDFDGEVIFMEPNTRYVLGLQFAGDDNIILIGYSDAINYYQISTITYSSSWFLGGLGSDFAANINVEYALGDNVEDTLLPAEAMNAFPNPTSDQISLEVDLELTGKANIVFADMTGKIMKINEYENLTNGTYSFDVRNYPNGVYMARLVTAEGSRTVKFTVQH